MFFEFKHGGHALTQGAADAAKAQPHRWCFPGRRPGGWSPPVVAPEQAGDDFDPDSMTPFRYLIETDRAEDFLPAGVDTVKALDALGAAMVAQDPSGDSSIPPVFTYWSQFIDHELTARTDRDTSVSDITVEEAELKPAPRAKVEYGLLNRRTPAFELDAIYGDGLPGRNGYRARRGHERNLGLARKMRDGAKMRVGTANLATGPDGQPVGQVPPATDDLNRDLPRIGALLAAGIVTPDEFPESLRTSKTFEQHAFIGDPRNDENLVVAQFHVAMLRFHNAVVDWLLAQDPQRDRRDTDRLFEDARRIVRWTFQWLVVNQFLKTLLQPDVVDRVLHEGAPLYRRQLGDTRGPFMPVEFSAACYRFGHSMIRDAYDYNRNFGRKPEGGPGFLIKEASLNLLFRFTGKSPTPFDPAGKTPQKVLPHNWIIEWDRFDGTSPHDGADGQPGRFTRMIDTHLAQTLGKLPNEGEDEDPNDRISQLLKQLARRNLRRGYQLSLPTGQAMARAVDAGALSRDELSQGNSPEMTQAMEAGGFFDRTPLWFYVLKEAEVRGGGQRLGEVGSRVVAETFVGVLLADPESYLAQNRGWDPSQPVPCAGGATLKMPDGRTIGAIADLFRFAGVAV